MPRISIIIPTYRHADYLPLAIRSVLDQSFSDFRLIIVNDGSPDHTDAAVQPFLSDPRIRYIKQENQGQSAARNRGLLEADGDYVAFFDDDDLWPQGILAHHAALLDSQPTLGLVCGLAELIRQDGSSTHQITQRAPSLTFETLFERCPMWSPGQALLRLDLVRKLGGFSTSYWGVDDWDLWFRLARTSTLLMHERVSLQYRLHNANASHDTRRMLSNSLTLIRKHLSELPPARQSEIRRIAYRHLYKYLGRPLNGQLRNHLIAGRLSEYWADTRINYQFLTAARFDPYLFLYSLRDYFTPAHNRHTEFLSPS